MAYDVDKLRIMNYRAEAVANRFLELAEADGKSITLMKLLKLVYFAHGWHLAITERPLVRDTIEAWQFGPVAPSVYHAFKENGSDEILEPYKEVDTDFYKATKGFRLRTLTLPEHELLDLFMKRIWKVYGKFSAFQLSALTHEQGTPWYQIWYEEGGSQRRGADIPDGLIKEYFQSRNTSRGGQRRQRETA